MAGDIGSTVKLKGTGINHTLHEKGKKHEFAPIDFPKPIVRVSIVPRLKSERKSRYGMHAYARKIVFEAGSFSELRPDIIFGMVNALSATRWVGTPLQVETEFIDPRVPFGNYSETG